LSYALQALWATMDKGGFDPVLPFYCRWSKVVNRFSK
jgi:hypothetical protein